MTPKEIAARAKRYRWEVVDSVTKTAHVAPDLLQSLLWALGQNSPYSKSLRALPVPSIEEVTALLALVPDACWVFKSRAGDRRFEDQIGRVRGIIGWPKRRPAPEDNTAPSPSAFPLVARLIKRLQKLEAILGLPDSGAEKKEILVFREVDGGYIAFVVGSGANAQGRTLDEAYRNLLEARELVLEAQEVR